MKARDVEKELKNLGSSERAKASKWFFKTQKGQYGYGDLFFGVSVPKQRDVAKKYKDLPLPEISLLLKNKTHECRLAALFILVGQYKKSDESLRKKIAMFYLKHSKFINNWDLVDSSAPYILGPYLLNRDRAVLYTLACSKNLWEKRIAVISTFAFIKQGQLSDTFKIAEILLKDPHDLIHKAVGWALREAGKKTLTEEEKFLEKYASIMPRTMLRYAIEKFSPQKRSYYLLKRG